MLLLLQQLQQHIAFRQRLDSGSNPPVFAAAVCGRILLLELLKQQHHKPKAQSPGVELHFRAHASKEIKMLHEENGARRDATRATFALVPKTPRFCPVFQRCGVSNLEAHHLKLHYMIEFSEMYHFVKSRIREISKLKS